MLKSVKIVLFLSSVLPGEGQGKNIGKFTDFHTAVSPPNDGTSDRPAPGDTLTSYPKFTKATYWPARFTSGKNGC